MSYRKFGKNDIRINTMKAHPKCDITIYRGNIYLNDQGRHIGENQTSSADPGNVFMTKTGYENLYEYNIDRRTYKNKSKNFAIYGDGVGPGSGLIYPFLSKNSARISFAITGTYGDNPRFLNEFAYGGVISGTYPLKTSIRRTFTTGAATAGYLNCTSQVESERLKCLSTVGTGIRGGAVKRDTSRVDMNYFSLKSILSLYSAVSPHYEPIGPYGNKSTQDLNIIHIPSIFYGEKIKPGTVCLRWYYTGSLLAEVRDIKENGELIQVGPTGSLNEGLVQGVVLYNEGFVILTGSKPLGNALQEAPAIGLRNGGAAVKPCWKYWGAGARDGVTTATAASGFPKAAFGINFKGTTKTEVVTMYAHAKRGEVNYSNNPTFIGYDQRLMNFTSSHVYEENHERKIKNTKSSSYIGYKENFERQVYISKIAVYDEQKNLIGIATLSNPVLKEEDQDIAFKIKLDI